MCRVVKTRVPGGVEPDPDIISNKKSDPAFKNKSDPDPSLEKNNDPDPLPITLTIFVFDIKVNMIDMLAG